MTLITAVTFIALVIPAIGREPAEVAIPFSTMKKCLTTLEEVQKTYRSAVCKDLGHEECTKFEGEDKSECLRIGAKALGRSQARDDKLAKQGRLCSEYHGPGSWCRVKK